MALNPEKALRERGGERGEGERWRGGERERERGGKREGREREKAR